MSERIIDADREALEQAIASALTDDKWEPLRKKARNLTDDIVNEIEWSMKDSLASNLAYHVKDMAERAVNALLAGNHKEMVRWLSCDASGYTGRSDGYGQRSIEDQHPVIHGALHESGCIALRKKIAQAHRDLIADQRILDLEDQVKSLVAQVNKATADKERILERARNGEFA